MFEILLILSLCTASCIATVKTKIQLVSLLFFKVHPTQIQKNILLISDVLFKLRKRSFPIENLLCKITYSKGFLQEEFCGTDINSEGRFTLYRSVHCNSDLSYGKLRYNTVRCGDVRLGMVTDG